MPTILFPSPIFGPVISRRLGVSLGINLIPEGGKLCSFDCIYCECGFNASNAPRTPRPKREAVAEALEKKLQAMQAEEKLPDVITFAGNGEPTMHPQFPAIIDDTLRLRNEYCPKARVAVLSNAFHCERPTVREALLKVDDAILKLDTVDEDYIRHVDRPTRHYHVQDIIAHLAAFDGQACIQTLFMKGMTPDGFNVDNTGDAYVLPWIEALRQIRPRRVMIYTIDRETPTQGLLKATPKELDRIADLLRQQGFEAEVSY